MVDWSGKVVIVMLIFLIVLAVVVGGYIVSVYNKLSQSKVRIGASIQEIGNQLKRQAELIPNLSKASEKYLSHEKGIFESLAEARKAVSAAVKSGDSAEMAKAGELSGRALGGFFAFAENNPEIKASGPIQELMANLRDSSDKVMYSRRLLIDLTADYNTVLQVVPSKWVGSLFGFASERGLTTPKEGAHLEVSESELKTPKI